jgi:parvulin-like peptidyl-prolyl isomerase
MDAGSARMNRAKAAAWLLALAVLGEAACGGARPSDPVILALGEQTVRRSDFDRHVSALESRGGPVNTSVREALLEPFLEERVLVLEARARGLIQPNSSPLEEQGAVRKVLADVLDAIDVTEQEVEQYYREHASDFSSAESVTLRQILVPTENEARDVRRRLQKDPSSFEMLARSRSRSPEASAGGLMGVFARGQLPPELELAAFGLPKGGLSELVTTPLGWHVLRLDHREPARERTLPESRDAIRSLLLRQKSDRGVRQFVQGLLARAKVNHEAAKAPHRLS